MFSPLVHTRQGSGEPVVLIHGIGHRRQAWGPVFDRLAERYDVIAVDLAGFGESPAFPAGVPYTMDVACEHLGEQFAAWGIERPHVVGNSLGGAIALELGARGLARSVTALSPAGFFGRFDRYQALGILSVLRLVAQLPDRWLAAAARPALGRRLIGLALYAHPERHDRDRTYGDALALKHCEGFEAVAKEGLDYEFRLDVTVPTTVAWGTKDRILPYRQSARARHRLPQAHHVPLVGAGHVPMSDSPDEIVALVDATVGRARTGAAA
ncbi:alpha/beta fold hydrolase [Nocardioides sp. ChNu-153]|uniref:alpha/beta fold hydrolase n=1 Tax=unclassified Nocardioides TaxID=2615069 RepID=UPI002405FFB1|nr:MULTISPECIES: alpha/beta hydrolase [unclassified Nocardioides]MDF9717748.1 alpha/beta hydrolase [Nocardioides sp. ChNu-99]MDN7123201.1 alpha/beta fold hydrolase [Nocardioides sp. ChNu-153]